MMARSTTRSNQRPDTLMQDHSPPDRQNPLATHGRTIHWVNRCGAIGAQCQPLSVVAPTGDKMVRRRERRFVPIATFRAAANSILNRSPRRRGRVA
jgi:hypothetical protein